MKSRSRLTTRLRTGIPFSSHSILSGRENKKKPKRQLDARKEKPAQGSSNITGGQMTTTTTMLCSVVCNMPIDRRERTSRVPCWVPSRSSLYTQTMPTPPNAGQRQTHSEGPAPRTRRVSFPPFAPLPRRPAVPHGCWNPPPLHR